MNIAKRTEFSADWKSWIKTNIANGVDRNEIFKILLDEGYTYNSIQREMGYKPTLPIEKLVNPFNAASKTQTQPHYHNHGAAIGKQKLLVTIQRSFLPS